MSLSSPTNSFSLYVFPRSVMKSASILGLLLFGLIGACSAQSDYCALSCYGGATNIGCQNSGAFSASCPSDAVMVDMTPSLKAAIVKSHNEKRNTIAAGQLPGYSPAVRMATMTWNDELAKLASFNVKRCTFAHDACRATAEFPYAGQNLYKSYGSYFDDQTNILSGIDLWWNEYKEGNMADINYFTYDSLYIGHFTAIANAVDYAVGCAAVKFRDGSWDTLTLACNYAYANMLYEPVYVAGTTGSKCTAGMNPLYPALCSLSEKFKVN